MVETGRDRLARDGSRLKGADHAGRGRRFFFKRELKVIVSLNKDLRVERSHMMRNAAVFRSHHSNIASHCASGAVSNGRFRRAICRLASIKVDEIVGYFLTIRSFRVEMEDVLLCGNALSRTVRVIGCSTGFAGAGLTSGCPN
jgi:hypothetical protein